jgi:demethylsterigmatocystin 6-O-methyltransferase
MRIEGADIYILRHILHDWPDNDCIRIIRGIVDAMAPKKSKLLICDRIVPEMNAPLPIVAMDIRMAMILGGMERTKQQWNALFAAVGSRLILRDVFIEKRFHESVLELEVD